MARNNFPSIPGPSPLLEQLLHEIKSHANPDKALLLQKFFKTGPGQYAAGDLFHGLIVPLQRKLAKQFSKLSLEDLQTLIHSPFHEERLIALLILTEQYQDSLRRQDQIAQQKLVNFYLSSTKYINNWDLVDQTAYKILGDFLHRYNSNFIKDKSPQKPRQILYKLATSKNLWERRIAIISTFHFIKNEDFDETLKLSLILLRDQHDLMHKAVGWMLREVGKRNLGLLDHFLKENYRQMPRTTLRYAIEKHPEAIRQKYLKNLF